MQINWRAVLEQSHPGAALRPLTLHAAQLLLMGGHRNEAAAALKELVERNPNDLQAHQQLGALLKRIGRPAEAEQVLKKAALVEAKTYVIQAQDLQGIAEFIEASTGNTSTPQTAPAAYVTALFDQYADHFDAVLSTSLEYKAPELLLAACRKVHSIELEMLDILDLGCGTGLAGEVFRPFARYLEGVDLSTKMLEVARRKSIYDSLHAADIVPYLQTTAKAWSFVLAADVFVYMGDLDAIFSATRKVLAPGGHFAFTVESSAQADYLLQGVRRYAHSKNYLVRLAIEHQFDVKLFEETSTRLESLKAVQSYLVILRAS
jgi:predicted TPR repeat methyltransferase